jgi:predicted TPR repeat methyltransferase
MNLAQSLNRPMKPNPFSTSPNDPLAARRADYAEMLFGSGEPAVAAEVMLGALEVAPGWSVGWFRLGEFHEVAGARDAAVTAWRTALALDPEDHAGAALKLALAGEGDAGLSMPAAFVETLLDGYARDFDASLTQQLGYRGPDLLFEAIAAAGIAHFEHAVDLGCGTGLMGERLRPVTGRLVGYDISAGMLRAAAAKGIYDQLIKADLNTLDLPAASADLVFSTDVFMYVGDLGGIVPTIANALRPHGLFAFTVEKHEGDGFALRESRRYAHSGRYLMGLLEGAGLVVLSLSEGIIRLDRNLPIQGLVAVASRAAI